MNLQQAYVSGFERKSFVAYGIRMWPVTLGHVQLLSEMGCNFVNAPANITQGDVVMLVSVCAFPSWQEARTYLSTDAKKHAKELVGVMKRYKQNVENEKLFQYLSYYITKPMQHQQTGYEPRIPWWWSFAEFLQTEMGRSEEHAWNTIVSDAFAYAASFQTRNNSKLVMTERECYIHSHIGKGKTVKQMFSEGLL